MPQLQIFELVDALETGKKAKAKLLIWNGSSYISRGAKTVLVYSFAGSHGQAGDRGYCFLGSSDRWEAVGGLINESSFAH